FQLALTNDEKIYGGGQRALPLNRVGYQLKLYNNPWYGYANGADNLNYSVPYFQSSKGYGLLFNNGSKGYVDIGKQQKNVFEYGAVSGELNCFVFLGNSQQQLLKNYYASTGVQPMLPKWAAGNFLSRFGYLNEVQAKQIAAGMRQQQIPFDAIIFDLFWFGDSIKNTLGNLDWVNKKAWPNPQKMIADFKASNVQTILITEPFILEGTKNYEAGKQYLAVNDQLQPYRLTNFYFGYGGIVDVFRNDSKDWFWSFYQKQMNENGVTGWWGDLGEPENHPADAKHQLRDKGFQRLFGADEIHNLY
ncbi:MAG TPA: glycosyl hydrolase, partial [Chitinophagaceae bacterium]|nr:glycosyl hydrolase [Chitinophagaceae bacterium]